MVKAKITVVKRLNYQEILGDKSPLPFNDEPLCPRFEEGQEFLFDPSKLPPEDFCPWAYADIYPALMHLRFGGSFPWIQENNSTLSCCTDGARPVIFKIELVES